MHHSYINDFVKFRNVHTGKEHHIFHLHNHQWLFNPNDDNSNYLDAQGIGPGGGYTYEINFGGSGNRNKSAGDAIFHCHFYPHFAQGMWELWRNHDVFEPARRCSVSGGGVPHRPLRPEERRAGRRLHDDHPRSGQRREHHHRPDGARPRPPDGEIVAGTPIPAVVPLPGKPMAVMPGKVTVVPEGRRGDHPGQQRQGGPPGRPMRTASSPAVTRAIRPRPAPILRRRTRR